MTTSASSTTSSSPEATLQFLHYVGQLKRTVRTGWKNKGVDRPESVAEHMYRMGVMSLLLPSSVTRHGDTLSGELLPVDRDKVMRMALVHDLAESITGDITPFCGISKAEKLQRETDAMLEMCRHLPNDEIRQQVMALWNEYNEQTTVEARVTKDFDKLEMLLQAFEYETEEKQWGRLQDFFNSVKGEYFTSEVGKLAQCLDTLRERKIANGDNSTPS